MLESGINQELIALGVEAEKFFNSQLGRHLADRAELESEIAKEGLALVDPEDVKEIRRLQNIIMRHKDFKMWLNDLILAGDVAYNEYLLDENDALSSDVQTERD